MGRGEVGLLHFPYAVFLRQCWGALFGLTRVGTANAQIACIYSPSIEQRTPPPGTALAWENGMEGKAGNLPPPYCGPDLNFTIMCF